jgi:hypothetical protein
MDLSSLLTRSVALLWQRKTFWWLALLPAVGYALSGLGRLWLLNLTRSQLFPLLAGLNDATAVERFIFSPEFAALFSNGRFLLPLVFWLFMGLVGFWLLYTLAEAAVIAATLAVENGRSPTFRQSLSDGGRLLGRFIAIDALVFLPWFLIALAAMLILFASLLSAALLAQEPDSQNLFLTILGLGTACATLLACLLAPLSFATLRFRNLAFRDAALLQQGAAQSVRHTWQVFRRNVGAVLLLVALLWGLQYLFNLLMTGIGLPLSLLPALLNLGDWPIIGNVVGVTTAVLLALPQAILFTFLGVAWTLGYAEIIRNDERG